MSAEDKEDEAKNQEDRQRISQLQSEKARKQEVLARLKEKKLALDDELRVRQEDLRELQTQKVLEERKQRERSDSRQKETAQEEAVDDYMKDQMKTMLKECIPAFSMDSMDDGDEDSDGDQKDKKKEEGPEQKQGHESVLVSYLAEKTTDREKLEEYYVTYRIDRETTIAQLHRDACEYWGCSQDEYILAMIKPPGEGHVKDLKNLMVPPDGGPNKLVQSTEILMPRFRAHLHLIQKKVFDARMERLQGKEFNPFDDYGKATKANSSDSAADVKIKSSKIEDKNNLDDFAIALQRWPGVYNLVSTKQRPPTRQWAKIKLRDLVIYFTIAILSGIVLFMRMPNFLIMRNGIMQTLVYGIEGETDPLVVAATAPTTAASGSMWESQYHPGSGLSDIVNFDSVRTHEHIWAWLGGSFAYQVFDPRSSFRAYYTPVGFLRIRQQKAKERENCLREEVPLDLRGPCYYLEVKPGKYEEELLIIDGDFIDMTKPQSGRYPGMNPLRWHEAKDYSTDATGFVQLSYDGSGYSMDYDLRGEKLDNSYATFLQDLPFFQDKWVDKQTRMLTIEFTAANYNLGGFANCHFLFEMPASGSVNPLAEIKPIALDYSSATTVLDVIRGLLVMYIALIKVYFETKRKTAAGQSGFDYIFSFLGFIDECTVAIYCAMTYMRLTFEAPPADALRKFYSYSFNAYVYEQFFLCEGIFFLLIMIRLCAYMRLNSMVQTIWRMFGRAAKMYGYFLYIFGPIFLATIMIAHALYSPYIKFFSTWYQTIVALVYFNKQDINVNLMYAKQRFWTLPFVFLMNLTFVLFFLNGFLAIAVHSYFEVKLSDMSQKEKPWTVDQWCDWMLWGPIYKLVFMKDPGSSRGAGEDVDDDEAGSDDDDDEEEKD